MSGSGSGRGDHGRDVSAALDAMAEALVLVDANDPATLEELLLAVRGVMSVAPLGPEGDGLRTAMLSAESAVEDAIGGLTGAEPMLATVVGCFETARSSLTNVPTLERSRAGSDIKAEDVDSPKTEDNPLADDPGLITDFITRSMEHLDNADTLLLRLEQRPGDREALDATFRVFHTIKGMAGFLGFTEIERFAHSTESFLDGPRKGKEEFSPQAFDAVFAAVDRMRDLVISRTPDASAATPSRGKDTPAATSGAPSAGDGRSTEGRGRRATDIVRVDEERLDLLLDTIGELVIAEAMVSEAAHQDSAAWLLLGEGLSRLDKITRELQEMATSMRMIPLRGTFGRMARLVRDLGQKAGKSVEFVTEGEETELDKAMVDLLYDPLVHLVRNAVDHGLEEAEDRMAAGKPRTGKVILRAYHAGGSVCVEVEDDGAGLDAEAILAKARAQGLVEADATLSFREISELLFLPGFSTAKKITDVSGRGVGMDVVRRTVEGLRGTIDISSTPGQGSRFLLRLPLTLAIIDGMVLRVGPERFILPTLSIQRSLRPDGAEVSSVLQQGEVLTTHDGLVPLVRLARLFEVPDADPDPTEGIVVIVGENGENAGLVASELLGQQQTVIKPLGEGISNAPGVAGGAIMPDGTVGLILDVSGLVRLSQNGGG